MHIGQLHFNLQRCVTFYEIIMLVCALEQQQHIYKKSTFHEYRKTAQFKHCVTFQQIQYEFEILYLA